ncbi:MAG: methionyl-tRNA formyltransferase [Anaerolineae bacterium]|nr:methionyl-tRNA formyltransferase [Anaerolineae bacterium]
MTRVVFMGTPDFAVPPLQKLIDAPQFEVVGVVTQPDRPAGRGNAIQQSPVKQTAVAANIPVMQPEKLRQPGAFEQLQAWQPDLIVVAAFGQILRQNVLDLPHYGCINVHASLLPRWRGAAPIQAVIRAGDAESGITIMRMDAGLDTGPMINKQAIPITPTDTGGSLHDKLAAIGGDLLLETLPRYLSGELIPQAQEESLQTYAPMIKKEDGAIQWAQSAAEIERQVRAYDPWPGTFTLWQGKPLKILPAAEKQPRVLPKHSGAVGEVIKTNDGMIGVVTGDGVYVLWQVQPAGKAAMPISAFINGYPAFIGAHVGS